MEVKLKIFASFGCNVDNLAPVVGIEARLRGPAVADFVDVTDEAGITGLKDIDPDSLTCLKDTVVDFEEVVDFFGVVEALKVVPIFGFGETMTPVEAFGRSLNEPLLKKY